MKSFKDILLEEVLTEQTKQFKVGQTIKHKDFDGGKASLKITKLHNDNKLYNTIHGVAGIEVEYKGDKYDFWFDTETLRKNKKAGKKSESYKKIIF